MAPDARGQEQKALPRGSQRGVLHGLHRGVLLAVEQLQPAIQVVGQHGDLEPVGVHDPAIGGMRRQASVVVGFLNEVLGAGTLVVEPDQQIQGLVHVCDENPVDVLRRIEELVLLGILVLFRPGIAQRQEAMSLGPAFGLIEELTLFLSVGLGRGLPLCHLQLLD
jgi:hypothetical protein